MIEIESIRIRNFRSFGDYDTVIKVDDLGPCLITGSVNDGSIDDPDKRSNGAGKSSIIDAILWCLFGRTSTRHNPGDRVINKFVGKDCIVELNFKNGDKLRRTRNCDGHNDLILEKSGGDVSLGTNRMEQERLNRLFDLDWDIFTGSTLFSQHGRSWMEMSDVKRKEALEREFHIDKIQVYADVAKERANKVKQEQAKLNARIDGLASNLESIKSQIARYKELSSKFESDKIDKKKKTKEHLDYLHDRRNSIELPDLDKIRKSWDLYRQVESKVSEKRDYLHDLRKSKRNAEVEADSLNNFVNKWKRLEGKLCHACEQPIPDSHVKSKIDEPLNKIEEYKGEISDLDGKIKSCEQLIRKAEEALKSKKPSMTISEAKSQHEELAKLDKQIEYYNSLISQIGDEKNHYEENLKDLETNKTDCGEKINQDKKKLGQFDKILLHINYVHRAYSDRRKIKSYMLSEYIPYLNNRIEHYSNRFKLDLSIKFTNALGIKSDMWDYEEFSGGERKRFDVALMLAIFDLHILMYGRNCNVIVFDEIDGRLDPLGAEIFVDIIRSDFAEKADSIFVISQRPDIRGTLPSEIRVVREEDRMSKVTEILK